MHLQDLFPFLFLFRFVYAQTCLAGCLADRATLCNFYSWPGSASSQYWGGYFVDARDSWGTMMYPLNERRFYTVGENCGRYEKIRYFETFLPANEITKVYGAMRTSDDCGPPFMSAFLHLYPHIAFIHAYLDYFMERFMLQMQWAIFVCHS